MSVGQVSKVGRYEISVKAPDGTRWTGQSTSVSGNSGSPANRSSR